MDGGVATVVVHGFGLEIGEGSSQKPVDVLALCNEIQKLDQVHGLNRVLAGLTPERNDLREARDPERALAQRLELGEREGPYPFLVVLVEKRGELEDDCLVHFSPLVSL